MTELTPSTLASAAPTAAVSPNCERITILANIIENLTGNRLNEDQALADQAHWLAMQIDELSESRSDVLRLAGIGLDLSQRYIKDDDPLGEELFFLFGEIADVVVGSRNQQIVN